jgi:hypothetical protein
MEPAARGLDQHSNTSDASQMRLRFGRVDGESWRFTGGCARARAARQEEQVLSVRRTVSLAVPDGAWVISRAMAFARAKRLDLEIVQDDAQIDLVEEGIDVALRMGGLMDSALTARVPHDANASSWAPQPTSIVRHAVHAE